MGNLTNPLKTTKQYKTKNIEVKDGPSTNLEASIGDRWTYRTGVPSSPPLPAPSSSSPAVQFSPSPAETCASSRDTDEPGQALSTEAGRAGVALTGDQAAWPRRGLASHQLPPVLHAAQSQAEGATGGSCLDEWAAAPCLGSH